MSQNSTWPKPQERNPEWPIHRCTSWWYEPVGWGLMVGLIIFVWWVT